MFKFLWLTNTLNNLEHHQDEIVAHDPAWKKELDMMYDNVIFLYMKQNGSMVVELLKKHMGTLDG